MKDEIGFIKFVVFVNSIVPLLLYACFYGFLHFLAYVWFDKSFTLSAITDDVFKRPFIAVGMLGFFLLVPLAVTSTNGWVKRLGGKNWNRLHKLAYVSGIAGV